ncbi:MAG: GTPase HflX [Gemmatimonadetes bacterium]|nr:GTPase HflX [Gemmatimonadota bacterium]
MPEVAICAGLRLPEMAREESEESLDELASLAVASGASVARKILQSRTRVDGRTFLGAGKAEQIKEEAEELGANLVLVDHELSPGQARNLEKITDLKVLDRTELILDIFARRARTPQAKLQVEVAQLEYLLPRLTRLWGHLSRLGGGIGTRGPGETQLEVDRRRIRERLFRLKRKLRSTGERLDVRRKLHPELFRISLVGYTNTGKSSLMNRLTDAGVTSRNRLFETLDATTRALDLGPGARATLTDTVGFVRRLPHGLVESFRATLSEVATSDLLLHVADATSPRVEDLMESVGTVLKEIDAEGRPQILVLNKCDGLDAEVQEGLRRRHATDPDVVVTSAVDGTGLDELREAIHRHLCRDWVVAQGTVPAAEGEVLARIRAVSEVLDEEIRPEGVHLRLRIPPDEWGRLRSRFADRAPEFFAAN